VNNTLRFNWHTVRALFVARNKEFYRDKGTLGWSFLMPFVVIAAIGFAFSGNDQSLFKVGVYLPSPEARLDLPFLQESYIHRINYQDFDTALDRLKHFQLDLLLSAAQPGKYWINRNSGNGKVIEELLLGGKMRSMERLTVTGREIRYIDWLIPGVLGMNFMFGALFGIGYVIVRYRKNGVLKRIQVTPVTPLQFLTAQVLSRLFLLMTSGAIIYLGCNLLFGFVMLGSYLDLFVVGLVGAFSMISMGLIISSRTASEELANGLLNLLSFPMMLISEVWFSLDDAPRWLHVISDCLPLTHMVKAAREIMLNGTGLADLGYHIWILVIMCVVFLILASLLFRWNEP
jgi:ABC-type multidrug transport system permease subunit